MAPPSRTVVTCYLYKDTQTKLWSAVTSDLSVNKVTHIQPEDTLKAIQARVLTEVADMISNGQLQLSDKVEVLVDVQLVSEETARRITGYEPPSLDEYGLP